MQTDDAVFEKSIEFEEMKSDIVKMDMSGGKPLVTKKSDGLFEGIGSSELDLSNNSMSFSKRKKVKRKKQ